MTVTDLISRLEQMPKDALVLGRGYESGYDIIDSIYICNVWHDEDHAIYDGEYQPEDFTYDKPENAPILHAVCIA